MARSKSARVAVALAIFLGRLLGTNSVTAGPAAPQVETRALSTGLRLMSVYFPGSTNVSVFSFVPLGLAADGPRHTQWAHLIEHLVIRSTVPETSFDANAETLPDHMRLDFYAHLGDWKTALEHQRQWLHGKPFTAASLRAEKPKVKGECDFTAKNFATHKFAAAAWAQAYRHGATNAAVKGDVDRAALGELQALRDRRLAVSNHVTVCVVGGVAPEAALAEAERSLGTLGLTGTLTEPVQCLHSPGTMKVAWDLDARHWFAAWPLPGLTDSNFPPFLVLAPLLNQLLAASPALHEQCGMTFAGADLTLPEGNFFYISASLKPSGSFEEVSSAILALVKKVQDGAAIPQAPMFAGFLSKQLLELPSLDEIKAQTPAGMDLSMVQMNVGLQFGMNEFRYGSARTNVAGQIAAVTAASAARAARQYLAADKALAAAVGPAKTK